MIFKLAENIKQGDILFINNKKMVVSNFLWRGKHPNETSIEHVEIMMECGEEIFIPVGLIVRVFNVGE